VDFVKLPLLRKAQSDALIAQQPIALTRVFKRASAILASTS
jgi:hypothetical protein